MLAANWQTCSASNLYSNSEKIGQKRSQYRNDSMFLLDICPKQCSVLHSSWYVHLSERTYNLSERLLGYALAYDRVFT